MSVLDNRLVCDSLRIAWDDSQPATQAAHEEGGFILRNAAGLFIVERWPRGRQNQIVLPPHQHGQRNGMPIVATFHTHPNPPPDFQQEPSLTDIRAVRDDAHLGGADYEGEFVIAAEYVYIVRKSGEVEVVGPTPEVLTAHDKGGSRGDIEP